MEGRKARIPQKIQDRMIALGMTTPRRENEPSVSELARRAGVSIMTCHQILTGGREPNAYKLYSIANALHISLESLTESLADSYLQGGSLSLITCGKVKPDIAIKLSFRCMSLRAS